jgi:hypothetical protein
MQSDSRTGQTKGFSFSKNHQGWKSESCLFRQGLIAGIKMREKLLLCVLAACALTTLAVPTKHLDSDTGKQARKGSMLSYAFPKTLSWWLQFF